MSVEFSLVNCFDFASSLPGLKESAIAFAFLGSPQESRTNKGLARILAVNVKTIRRRFDSDARHEFNKYLEEKQILSGMFDVRLGRVFLRIGDMGSPAISAGISLAHTLDGHAYGHPSIGQLSEVLNVDKMMIYRGVTALEKRGLISIVRGDSGPVQKRANRYDISALLDVLDIGVVAAGLYEEIDVVHSTKVHELTPLSKIN